MSVKQNKKNPVFQADELSLLYSLLYKYRNILENKHKGAVQVAQKTKYWSIVTNEFNVALLNITRTTASLRKCWGNRQYAKKAELCTEKRSRKKTGGGPEEVPCTSEVIDQFLTNISDVEIHSAHDSDAIRRDMLSSTPENLVIILQNYDYSVLTDDQNVEIAATEHINLNRGHEEEINDEDGRITNKPKKVFKKIRTASLNNDPTFDKARLEALSEESKVRIKRQELLIEQDAIIHAINLEEAKLKHLLAKQKYENEINQ